MVLDLGIVRQLLLLFVVPEFHRVIGLFLPEIFLYGRFGNSAVSLLKFVLLPSSSCSIL